MTQDDDSHQSQCWRLRVHWRRGQVRDAPRYSRRGPRSQDDEWQHLVTGLDTPAQRVPQGPVPIFDSASALTDLVKSNVQAALSTNNGEFPRLIMIGALGRCGKGAIAAAEAVGVNSILKADLFPEVASSDIFVNCVYLGANKTPPFTTFESLSGPERRPRVICDVSCDPNSENNPIPVYSTYSSFENPTAPGFWPP
ncbi:hypothetical protein CEP52_006305 [Fusarium oligoseptatum]|uniref:Alanine dehydrogenase/pyridine nucleotide transhydrogenase NAD(H)-binding domain-containing protein n=1 Tax=Fusarium oligoseptatum TaxID=2604345 RepID=A0A428TTW0_9HYPO|nr:hypothetical protein CEP52_006305 [Fusarium oligoseptatum]